MWKALAQQNPFYFGANLLIADVQEDHADVVTGLEFESFPLGTVKPESSVHPDYAIPFMQAVMDAAYEFGLRPSNMQDERHIQNHLKDMQEITRHVLKMSK